MMAPNSPEWPFCLKVGSKKLTNAGESLSLGGNFSYAKHTQTKMSTHQETTCPTKINVEPHIQ